MALKVGGTRLIKLPKLDTCNIETCRENVPFMALNPWTMASLSKQEWTKQTGKVTCFRTGINYHALLNRSMLHHFKCLSLLCLNNEASVPGYETISGTLVQCDLCFACICTVLPV